MWPPAGAGQQVTFPTPVHLYARDWGQGQQSRPSPLLTVGHLDTGSLFLIHGSGTAPRNLPSSHQSPQMPATSPSAHNRHVKSPCILSVPTLTLLDFDYLTFGCLLVVACSVEETSLGGGNPDPSDFHVTRLAGISKDSCSIDHVLPANQWQPPTVRGPCGLSGSPVGNPEGIGVPPLATFPNWTQPNLRPQPLH